MPNPAAPLIFDQRLPRLLRAARLGPVDFLLVRAVEDLSERLALILREFPVAADLGTPLPHFAEALCRLKGLEWLVRILPLAALQNHAPGSLDVLADLEALPFAAGTYHLIVSGFALQHINDLPGCLIQIRQALRPDGLFLGCFAGGQTLSELRQVMGEAEIEVTGGLSPRVFPFVEIREAGSLLQRAGFTLPVTDSDLITARYDDLFTLIADLRRMGATNILTERQRRPTPRRVFLRAAELYRERFSDADGRIRATFETLWVSGWATHESQQKPLKPGSAKQSLAEALQPPGRSEGRT